jgi:hypothetical protein
MLQLVLQEVEYGFDIYRATNGARMETYYVQNHLRCALK